MVDMLVVNSKETYQVTKDLSNKILYNDEFQSFEDQLDKMTEIMEFFKEATI
jgi:hypothetical protein